MPPERRFAAVHPGQGQYIRQLELTITEARKQFGSLVRWAATARERVTITDHGWPAAVLVNAQELADLEEQLALARYRADRAVGRVQVVDHQQVRAMLGVTGR